MHCDGEVFECEKAAAGLLCMVLLLMCFVVSKQVVNGVDGSKKVELVMVSSCRSAVMIVLMIIPFVLALPSFRRNKIKNLPMSLKKVTGYNSFWYSHHVFVLVYILYCIHDYNLYLTDIWYKRTSWMYLVVPLALYICERIA